MRFEAVFVSVPWHRQRAGKAFLRFDRGRPVDTSIVGAAEHLVAVPAELNGTGRNCRNVSIAPGLRTHQHRKFRRVHEVDVRLINAAKILEVQARRRGHASDWRPTSRRERRLLPRTSPREPA